MKNPLEIPVAFVGKSAGNSDLAKLIEFSESHLVERVSSLLSTELWWDRRGIYRFLFSMDPQETHSKFYRWKDMLEFCKADFGILQTQLIDGRSRYSNDPE